MAQADQRNVQNTRRRIHDIWALIGFITLYAILHRKIFEKFSIVNIDWFKCMHHFLSYFITFCICVTTSCLILSFYRSSMRYTTSLFFIVIPAISIYIYLITIDWNYSFITKDNYTKYVVPIISIFTSIVLILMYALYLRKNLDNFKPWYILSMNIYKDDMRKLFLNFLLFSVKLSLIFTITKEISKIYGERVGYEKWLYWVLELWSLFALLYSVKVFTLSLIISKMEYTSSYAKTVDDLFVCSGTIYFAGLLFPVRLLTSFVKSYKIEESYNPFKRAVLEILNMNYNIVDALTHGFGKQKSKYAIYNSYVYNISYLKGAKRSNLMINNEIVSDISNKNHLWYTFLPFLICIPYYNNLVIKRLGVPDECVGSSYCCFVAFYAIFIEFLYSTCNATFYLFLVKPNLVIQSNKGLFDVFNGMETQGHADNEIFLKKSIEYSTQDDMVIDISETPVIHTDDTA